MHCLFFPGPNGREAEARHYTDVVIRMVRGGTFVHPDDVSTLGRSTREFITAHAANIGLRGTVHGDGPHGATVEVRLTYAEEDRLARELEASLGSRWRVTLTAAGLRCRRRR